MKRPSKNANWRIIFALTLILASFIFAIIFGFLFGGLASLLSENNAFSSNFYNCSIISYFLFTASFAVAGILLLITTIPIDLSIGFGAGLYYGTIFLTSCLRGYIHTSDANLYFISGTIVSLICYIIWLKNFKSKYSDEDE